MWMLVVKSLIAIVFSDKSLAVGGGVLEAVTAWDYERNLDGNNL